MLKRLAYSSYFAVKHKVDWFDHWPRWQKVRREFQSPFYRIADTGLFGLTPLKLHIVICGFPASGTTLLQLMLENGLPDAKRFGKERSGWRAATHSLRNHAIMISKQPADMLQMAPLQEFYRYRRARLRTLLMLRDPRDLLTTQRRDTTELAYGGSALEWRNDHQAFLRESQRPDTLVVRFEDLIDDVDKEQQRVEKFLNLKMVVNFADYLSVQRSDFDTTTLRGLRPLDRTRIARWRDPIHRPRIVQMLRELPELPGVLRDLGYEKNDDWLNEFQSATKACEAVTANLT
jgi:hypothetical protein